MPTANEQIQGQVLRAQQLDSQSAVKQAVLISEAITAVNCE